MNEWKSVDHALAYLAKADRIPHRTEGEAALLEEIAPGALRVMDLGSGDGRLLRLVLAKATGARGVAVDFSPPMLEQLQRTFPGETETGRVRILDHDLAKPLPDTLGMFDAVVSSFAIHHLEHRRKRSLYREVFGLLKPGGVFCNLEHVASPTLQLHMRFLEQMGTLPGEEDPSNRLLDMERQLGWLRSMGFDDVDCLWKWRELALLAGRKPQLPA